MKNKSETTARDQGQTQRTNAKRETAKGDKKDPIATNRNPYAPDGSTRKYRMGSSPFPRVQVGKNLKSYVYA